MNRLCRTPLWNVNIMNSSYPLLTECFRNTVLQWIPISIFWLILPFWFYTIIRYQMKLPALPISFLFISKIFLTVVFLLIEIVRIICYGILLKENPSPSHFLSSIFYIITAQAIICVLNFDRIKRIFSSGLLFIFWLLVIISSIPNTVEHSRIFIQQNKSKSIWIEFILAWLHSICAFVSLICNCFVEKFPVENEKPVVPELYVSFLSRIFYEWVTPLIRRGYKRPLTEDDCWQLPISDKTATVVHLVGNRMKKIANTSSEQKIENEQKTLLTNMEKTNVKTSNLCYSLFRTYRDKILIGGILRLLADICQFSSPIILKFLLNFFLDKTQPLWLGIFYAIFLGLSIFCQILLLRAHLQCQYIVGLRFRSAISGLVYRKILKLSNTARQETTTGEIINLVAIDAAHFSEMTTHMHMLWLGPLQLLCALFLLYQQMRLAIIPGIVLLVVIIPINSCLQTIQKKLTAKQMTVKDQRIKLMNEILNGIRVLKLYAWEMAFIHSISSIRNKELGYIRQKAIVSAISNILWTFAPILVGITTFACYVLLSNENDLTADKAFVSLALLNLLRNPLSVFPNVINSFIEARVSNKRIEKFLNSEEIDENAVNKVPLGVYDYAIKIDDGSFRWSNNLHDKLILKNINLEVSRGSLVAIVGMVGSGKSSILASLFGEMNKTCGQVTVSGNVAYTCQTAWLINATFRENIIFGRDFDKKFYDRVIEACALKQDLDMLPGKDQTEIGEKGINLSGGQRQRVCLARALYSNADIYLLDDPLSAVDAHVATHIFKRVIGPKGLLRGKTRLLVTHNTSYFHQCDSVIVISQGQIMAQGAYKDLLMKNKILADYLISEKTVSPSPTPSELTHNPFSMIETNFQHYEPSDTNIEIPENKTNIIQKEIIATGSVKSNIFTNYIHACKLSIVTLIFVLFILTICISLCTNIWLSIWTDRIKMKTVQTNTSSSSKSNQIVEMSIYSALGIGQGIFLFVMQLIEKLAGCTAGKHFHWILLIGILHAPMSFFDTTPIGRIINRFSKEIDCIDITLPNAFSQLLTALVIVLTTLIILIYASWFTIFQIIPLAIVFAYIQRLYISSSRQLRRLDLTTRSHIFAHFGETIQGIRSIRAYQLQQRFINLSDKYIDRNQSCQLASTVCNRWLGIRLEILANLLTLFASLSAVLMRDRLTGGIVGLTITYALQITHSLNILIRTLSDVETNITSIERINEYAHVQGEAPWEIPETKPSSAWPMNGRIEIKHLSTRYRENLELSGKDITIDIQQGEKIGIVGRTGSGKSSLCLALFRIVEPANGTIIIDDVDIRLIGLHDLRSKITIIPQDALIFHGTVRFNMDPLGCYSDTQIWSVLELVGLKNRISALKNGLSFILAGDGHNLSVGEKQLLCLARALLRKTKIFILDEATATIDMESDRLIQQTIRSVLKDATVLTIAHRLHTILDSNKILVMSNGCVQEFDEPNILASNSKSEFSKLLRDANVRFN